MRKNKLYILFLLLFFCLSQGIYAGDKQPPKVWGNSGTGGNTDKAYTDKWYEETASSLTISSDKDLGALIKALNEGKTFEDKTIELTKDIDMSKYLWASTEKPFKGVFNGNGHTIKNMNSGADSYPWAFIGVVEGGEIDKVSISGSFVGDKVTGGIAGKLTNGGKITNSAYTGLLAVSADTVKLGGIVGINDGGTVTNCFFAGSVNLIEGNVAGNIAGTSTGTVSNSYYLLNEQMPLGIGEDTGTTTDVSEQSAEAFASGEVSWLLNQYNGIHSGIWSIGDTVPVYVSATKNAVYKISYIDTEKGTVKGVGYAIADSVVNLIPQAEPGYLCSGFSITGSETEVEVVDNSFVMPAADLQITGEFVDFEGPAIAEATDIISFGFTAHWEAVEGAVDYLLTVKTAAGTVLESYDAVSLGDTTSYAVINLLPDTEYKYSIQAKTIESVSKMSQESSVRTVKGSTVTYSPNVVGFKIGDNAVESQKIAVSGNYVTADIAVSLRKSTNFSVSVNTLPKEGGDLVITYHSVAPGSHKDTLTLSTTGAQDVIIPLKGVSEFSNPKPTVSSVEKYSFLAKWDAVAFAEKYLVTLSQNGTIVEGYDNVETTECTYEFSKLKANTKYSLTVSSVLDGDTLSSQTVNVTTNGDYGKQLNNSGFEYWEGTGDNAEPVDWNSFMTQYDGFSMAYQAKVKHMEQTDKVRPNSAGNSSTRIWTKSIVGVNANGTLTCGRINAGSMTATDYANHNYTIVGDPNFSEAIGGAKPDSLTVWVKYNPKELKDSARISAVIHDTYKYQDPTDNPEIQKHEVAKAIVNYSTTEEREWQRISIPFDYCGPSTSADYMLVTFASNMTAGGGSKDDEVFIDDMLLIYNPKVAISKVDRTSYKQGGTISVNYTIDGTMSPSNLNAEPNVVTLQLSDAEGSFENPIILTSVITDYSGTLTAVIPEDCPLGKGYRVRVVTTNYPLVSEPNADDIEIFEPGASNISSSKIDNFTVTMGESAEQVIKVEGIYLVKGINVALDKNDQGFSIDKTTLPEEGGDIVVTYSPASVGTNAATITLTSEGLDKTVTINLSGIARPAAPVLSAVVGITPASFVANWTAVENATDYELTVIPVDGEAVTKSVGAVTSYVVADLLPATEYTYSLLAKVGEIVSLPSVATSSVTTLNKPQLTAETDSIGFDAITVGSVSESKSLTVNVTDLYSDIKVEVSGDNFVANYASILKAGSKTIELTYKPVTVSANHQAKLIISTEYGNTLEIKLTGSSLPAATKALAAEEVTPESFLAKWDAVEGATYRFTVKKDDEVLSGYDAAPVRKGNSVTVKGLDASTKYTYSVVVVLNSQVSENSNSMEITTLPLSCIKDISSKSKLTAYPNPVINDLYIQGGNAQKIDVFTLDGVYAATYRVLENKVNVGELHQGAYIFVITDEEGNASKVRVIKE